MTLVKLRLLLLSFLLVLVTLAALVNRGSIGHRSPHQTRVAVCFFGLTRSLDVTVESIRRGIIDPLRKADYEVEVFLHTYRANAANNPRSEEVNATYDWEDWKLLQPSKMFWDDADKIKETLYYPNEEAFLLHGDPWEEDHHTSLRNLVLQLFSLHRVSDLWRHRKAAFDVVMCVRMDVWFFNQISLEDLVASKVNPQTLYTPPLPCGAGPDWTNDMFAFGHPDAMLIWARRLDSALQFSTNKRLDSEVFLWHVLQSAGIEVRETHLLLARVRATKEIWALPAVQGDRLVVPWQDPRDDRPGLMFNRSELGLLELVPAQYED